MQPAIVVQSLGKRFRHYSKNRPRTLMTAALSGLREVKSIDYFWALRDVSLTLFPGQMLGVVGHNGAGKSTLLRLLGRVGRPDEGEIILNGRVGALLDLGAGFHPDLTGRENVVVNAVVAGLLQRDAVRQFDAIVEFAELSEFIDNPVRTYSTGMTMRLAFAVAVHTQPAILLVDEHLAVGDQTFQNKCLDRILQMKAEGCAIVLISHNAEQIAELCDRVIWLKQGRIWAEGVPETVIDQYLTEMGAPLPL